jgi:hypothetical protein
MNVDFLCVRRLRKAISAIEPAIAIRIGNPEIEAEVTGGAKNVERAHDLSKSLSCHICDKLKFGTLEEFRQHRRSADHLARQMGTLALATALPQAQEQVKENILPVLKIVCDNHLFLLVYKILLYGREDEQYKKNSLPLTSDLHQQLKNISECHIFMGLNGGGYFAAAIIDIKHEKVVRSKTLRKYTSRRKQGGSQSSKDDASNHAACSAGAMIRRENEKRLCEQILELLDTSWKSDMNNVSLAICNGDSFLQNILRKSNFAVRNFPFTTFRASLLELSRCFETLFTINATPDP